jgi:hypothetical protein
MSRRRQETANEIRTNRWSSPGLEDGGTFRKKDAEHGRPYPTASRAKAAAIRPTAEEMRCWEGFRGVHSTVESAQDNALEGRGPDLVMVVMEVSARAWSKDPKTPKTKYENSNAAYGCVPSEVRADVFMRCMTGFTEVTFCGKRGNGYGRIVEPQVWIRRHLRSLSSEGRRNF